MNYEIDVSEHLLYQEFPYLLEKIIFDKTTKKNIIWATDNYSYLGEDYLKNSPITISSIIGYNSGIIKPRSLKDQYIQSIRTKDKGEVFTPSWICNLQNNLVDEAWFARSNIFNKPTNKSWITNHDPIVFPEGKHWQDYIQANRLEISCGEAPYLVSRYDSVTGNPIPTKDRIGILDRKLRIVSENTQSEKEWIKWTFEAYKSTYGYEFQGDNLILARENLLFTFFDYLFEKFNRKPTKKELKKLINIICWNIWQMDGITMTVPYSNEEKPYQQISMFETKIIQEPINCRIYDWKANRSIEFRSLLNK